MEERKSISLSRERNRLVLLWQISLILILEDGDWAEAHGELRLEPTSLYVEATGCYSNITCCIIIQCYDQPEHLSTLPQYWYSQKININVGLLVRFWYFFFLCQTLIAGLLCQYCLICPLLFLSYIYNHLDFPLKIGSAKVTLYVEGRVLDILSNV